METWIEGRALLISEIPKERQERLLEGVRQKRIHVQKGFETVAGKSACSRCGASHPKDRYKGECPCGNKCAYCLNCLQMGKVSECSSIYWLPSPESFRKTVTHSLLAWEGTLSDQQQKASEDVVEAMKANRTHLVWAVAGAGKTEMMFEGINQVLKEGKRVCVACPRVDVCLELAPRLKQAFPTVPLIVLHGSMEEAYRYTPLVVATTHQLLRFKEAFDVLVIDEVDAFPFYLDEGLTFGAQKARKKQSSLIYLSATPDVALQKEVKKGHISASILPARYHGYPLPVPTCKWVGDWKKYGAKVPSWSPVIRLMKKWIDMERSFLVFIPNIEWMRVFEQACQPHFPNISFTSVSSKDPERKEKVQRMREKEYRFLLSTTILERGVTFPNIHVLVLGSEDETFTEAALVQISGRAGRSPLYPSGDVVFLHFGKSIAMKKAIHHIQKMNALGRKRGYLTHG